MSTITNTPRPLSSSERTTVKKLIAAHPDWNEYRAKHLGGRNTGELKVAELWSTLDALEIYLSDVLASDMPDPSTVVIEPDEELAPAPAPVKSTPEPAKPAPVKANKPRETITRATIKDTFGVSGPGSEFELTVWNSPFTPAEDEHYVFNTSTLLRIMATIERGGFVWLGGPSSTGKTTLSREIAARTKRPFFRIAFNRSTEMCELVGQKEPDGSGTLKWMDGTLLQAVRTPGAIILLDEPTLLRSGSLAVLSTALDEKFLTIPETGERVVFAEGVTFIAADNTFGTGDETGQYLDTQPVSLAFRDRFEKAIAMGFLAPSKETEILSAKTGLPRACAATLVAFATVARKHTVGVGSASGDLAAPVTLRRLMAWARDLVDGIPSKIAYADCVTAMANPDDLEALNQLFNAHGNAHDEIDRLAKGDEASSTASADVPEPATGEASTPEGKRAQRDFR